MDWRRDRDAVSDGRERGHAWLRPELGAAALLLLATSACAGPEQSEPPVTEEVYVEVMGRLAAVRTATDPGHVVPPMPAPRADSIRSELLSKHGVMTSDLKEFARVVGDEPARMRALWERIDSVSDSLWRAGWPPLSGDRRVRGGRRPASDSAAGDGGPAGGPRR